jgi:ribonuclease BN (tRNA processing enzyme)
VGLQINTILVNTGDKLVLIDAGCGVDRFQNTTGGLLGNLAAAGYAPGDIDMILFTHFHFDHLWGISDHENASLLFPSAEFVASETEVAFWSDPELAGKLPPAQQPRVTQTNLKLARPQLHLIKAAAEVAPGGPPSTRPVTRQATSRSTSVPAAKKCSSPATSWSTQRSASSSCSSSSRFVTNAAGRFRMPIVNRTVTPRRPRNADLREQECLTPREIDLSRMLPASTLQPAGLIP